MPDAWSGGGQGVDPQRFQRTATTDKPTVQMALEEQMKLLADLFEHVCSLENRLSPIVSYDAPPEGQGADARGLESSNILDKLRGHNMGISLLTSKIRRLERGLQL